MNAKSLLTVLLFAAAAGAYAQGMMSMPMTGKPTSTSR